MKDLRWFRLYAETVDDDKLNLLAFEDRWHFIAILCCKAKGIIDEADEFTLMKVRNKLGLDQDTFDKTLDRLARVKLIDRKTLQPLGWDGRQFTSDHDPTAKDRLKRFRDKKKTETHMKRVSNPLCNGDETRSETETDTDKTYTSTSVDLPAGFGRFWAAWPAGDRKVAKATCLKKWKTLGLESRADQIVAWVVAMKHTDAWMKGFQPAPLTAINQRRWEDGSGGSPFAGDDPRFVGAL